MKKILHYEVEITDNTGIIKDNNKFTCTELNVIGENSLNIVVDDLHFTTVKKEKCKYSTYIGKESIYLNANDSVWGNRVTYSLFTYTKKRASKIKSEINAAIAKKYGFFISGVDLSIIKDSA